MQTGNHGRYYWLESVDLTIEGLLSAGPGILTGKYIVVTAFDSGPLRLSEEELAAGWTQEDGLVYSPKIGRGDSVPRGEYDEWYIFPSPTRMDFLEVFVNDSGFTLRDPAHAPPRLDPAWNEDMLKEWREPLSRKQARFWSQLESIQPEAYLAEGGNLIFVTRDVERYKNLLESFHHRD